MANDLWMAVWFDAGSEDDGVWRSFTHYGKSFANSREAWAEAQRLCEEFDGIGFTVRHIEPVNSEGATTKAPSKSRRINGTQQSSRGAA